MSEEKKNATKEAEETQPRLDPGVETAFATIAKQLNAVEYSEFEDVFFTVVSAIQDLEGVLVNIKGTPFEMGEFVPMTDEEVKELGEGEEAIQDYSDKIRSTLKLALALSPTNILHLDDKLSEIRALRKREKELGVQIGSDYKLEGKTVGQVIDLRKGRKIVVQKPDGKRIAIIPMKLQELEDDDD